MPRAHVLIRFDPPYRRQAFCRGLEACGFLVDGQPRRTPDPVDVLVIWNRYGVNERLARQFEAVGARVIIAENGYLGRDSPGGPWYSLSLGQHGGAGTWPNGGAERWQSFGITICDWRKPGAEVIILAQRGIGSETARQPDGWHRRIAAELKARGVENVRIREHPGEKAALPLESDLATARCCVTWASGAALKALLLGIPVYYGYEKWIGADAGYPLQLMTNSPSSIASVPRDRAAMFQRLAWSIWRIPEIEAGVPFRALLALPSTASPSTIAARS